MIVKPSSIVEAKARRVDLEQQIRTQEQIIIAMMKVDSFTQMPIAQQKLVQLRIELRALLTQQQNQGAR